MDSAHFITTMPSMDIFAHEPVSSTEKSMLRRQKTVPERCLEEAYDFDSENDLDFEDDYFSKTYAPLSCLPTPPMPFEAQSPFTQALESAFGDDEESSLLGPALHMSNLIPTSASLLTSSPTLVQDILHRANLPQPVLELTVVILDSLTPRFATNYRRQLPLSGAPGSHIDEVRPELIVLSSLLVANRFLDDNEMPTGRFARDVGAGLWTCSMINTTERLILECIGWNIMELSEDWLLQEAREDMARAGVMARRRQNKKRLLLVGEEDNKNEQLDLEMKMDGAAGGSTLFLGQWTPVESPVAMGRVAS